MVPGKKRRISGPQQLYRYFNADGDLLYVGISANAFARMTQHQAGAQWWTEIATVTVEWFDSRREVLDAERDAIKSESPIWNKQHAEPVPCGHCANCTEDFPESCMLITGEAPPCDCGRPGCPYPSGYRTGHYDGWMRLASKVVPG